MNRKIGIHTTILKISWDLATRAMNMVIILIFENKPIYGTYSLNYYFIRP